VKRSSRLAFWRRVAALVGLGVIVAFVGLEANLRLFGGPIEIFNPLNGFHDGDALLGWRGLPSIQRRFHRDEFDVLVVHDEDGFRLPDPPRPAEAQRNLLVLGDSIVWGWGVEQGEVVTDRLQRELAPDVAVFNRGVNAFSTGQELLLLQEEVQRRRYETIVVVVSRTDLGDNADRKEHRPGFDLEGEALVPRNQPAPSTMKNPVERFIDDHSRAVHFLSWQLAAWKSFWRGPNWVREAFPEEDPEARTLPGYAVTGRLLREIVSVGAAHGAHVVLAFATTALDTEESCLDAGLRELVQQVARLTSAGFVDLAAPLREAARAGTEVRFPVDEHWNPTGHRLAAEALLPALASETK